MSAVYSDDMGAVSYTHLDVYKRQATDALTGAVEAVEKL